MYYMLHNIHVEMNVSNYCETGIHFAHISKPSALGIFQITQ